ncbi:MAG: ABC transporter permease [Actinomycetota bacterium]
MSVAARRTVPAGVAILAGVGALFVTLPLLALLVRTPWSDLSGSLSRSGAWTALRVSLVVSLAASALSLLLGVPLAFVLARSHIPGRALLRAVALLPLVLPPVVGGIALLAALGRSGLIGRWLGHAGIQLTFTTLGAVIATAFVSIPLVVLATETGLRAISTGFEEAARVAGASRWYILRRVTLPMLRSQILAGGVLAWARALGEFGATITFAGNLPGRTQTLPLSVFVAQQRDPGGAVATSLILVVVSVAVLVLMRKRLFAA